MRPIVKDLQTISYGMPGIMAPQTQWGAMTRNTVMLPASQSMRLDAPFAWVGNYFASGFGGDKYKIPEHEGAICDGRRLLVDKRARGQAQDDLAGCCH